MQGALAATAHKRYKDEEDKKDKKEIKSAIDTDGGEDGGDGGKLEDEIGKYNKYTDPDAWNACLRPYLLFANLNEKITKNSHFNNFIIFCIVLAGLLVGAQTYEGMDDDPVVLALDTIILIFFSLECIFKIFAEGLAIWRFWLGPEWKWNNFDFFIVLACIPGLLDLGKQVVVLRLLRLMRLAKVFRKIPQLQMIVMGLVGGMKSISYIVLLLFLVFYLFAILGMMLFQENDPFHWSSLDKALMTLFRAATLEDWTDIMYFNIYGCDVYKVGGGITYCDVATEDCSHLLPTYKDSEGENVYIANEIDCIVENCTRYDKDEYGDVIRHVYNKGNFTMYDSSVLCHSPSVGGGLAAIYFIMFIVISALVMLSLFVGAVTMAMAESMEEMKRQNDEKDKQRRLEKGKQAALELQKAGTSTRGSMLKNMDIAANLKEQEEQEAVLTGKAARERVKMKVLLMAAWDGTEVDPTLQIGPEWTGWKKHYVKVAGFLEWLTEHPIFQNFVTFVILIAGLQVGFQTYEEEDIKWRSELDAIDLVISTIFTVEVAFKLVACEFEPWFFFNSGWNKFDFALVVGGYLPLDFDLKMLRLLRLLRVLKLVNKLPQLQVIITALMMGVGSIGYIGVILCIFFYFFAIIGMIFFGQNDPWHFGTLHMTMLTLFRASTLEDWTDIMYINTYGCKIFGYSDAMNGALNGHGCGSDEALRLGNQPDSIIYKGSPVAGLFFLIFIMIGALVLLTLFVGVVTTSMEEATADMKEALEVEEEVQKVAQEEGINKDQVEMYRTVFGILDLDGGGSIEEDELKIGLEAIDRCPTDKELQTMLLEVDESGDGEVDFAEFLQFMMVVKRRQAASAKEMTKVAEGDEKDSGNDRKKSKKSKKKEKETNEDDGGGEDAGADD